MVWSSSLWSFAPYITEDGWTPASVPFLQASVLFLTLVYVFEAYLDVRQRRKLKETAFPAPLADATRALDDAAVKKAGTTKSSNKDSEDNTSDDEDDENTEKKPDDAASLMDQTLEKFDKSRAYGLDQSTSKLVSDAYKHALMVSLLLLGGLPFLWALSGNALTALGLDEHNEIYRSAMFFMLHLFLHEQLPLLPVELYSNFVVEARHDFNRQSLGFFFVEKLKQVGLVMLIVCPTSAALVFVVRWGGEHFYLYVWAAHCAIFLAWSLALPVWTTPFFQKCTPLEDGGLHTRLATLASRINFPVSGIVVIEESTSSGHVSAACIGLFLNQRIFFYDMLLELLTTNELVAVLRHELGHWKLAHANKGFLTQQVFNLTHAYVFGMCMNNRELFASFGFARDSGMPVMIGFMLFSKTVCAPVGHVLSFLLRLEIRRTEFQYDTFAADQAQGEVLKSALTKVAIGNLVNMNPDPLYSKYHYDHPSLVERLAAIMKRMKKSS